MRSSLNACSHIKKNLYFGINLKIFQLLQQGRKPLMWERLKFTQRFAWVNKTKVGFYILTSCLCKGRVQKSLVFCQTHTQVHHVVADSSGMESIKGKNNMFWDLLTSSPKMFFEVHICTRQK